MLHATPHQRPDTNIFSITIESTYLGVLMPRAKNALKNHDTLFWINRFVWPRNHTHKKNNVSETSSTREKMTTITTTTHSKKTTCKIAHDAVSPVPSSHQCTEPEPTETRTSQNIRKTIRKHEPNRIPRSKQQILTTTPPAIDLHTPQHRRLKQVDSLSCVIWRSCHRRRTCRCHTEK